MPKKGLKKGWSESRRRMSKKEEPKKLEFRSFEFYKVPTSCVVKMQSYDVSETLSFIECHQPYILVNKLNHMRGMSKLLHKLHYRCVL